MKRFLEGECRDQSVLFPERLDDWIAEDNPVRAVDAFIDELDFETLGFAEAEPAPTISAASRPNDAASGIEATTRTAARRCRDAPTAVAIIAPTASAGSYMGFS